MSRIDTMRGAHRALVVIACVVLGAALAGALIWPITDLIAAHDVGLIGSSQRAAHLQTAREAVRTQLLTLGAGLFAAGALVYTARNFTLSRHAVDLTRRTVELTEQGQVTDRYTKAIEQLGSEKLDVRLGGIYALERIAHDSARDHPTVMEVLAAFVREHSRSQEPSPRRGLTARRSGAETASDPPTAADVQAALDVIGRRDPSRDTKQISLIGAQCPGVSLRRSDFSKATFFKAELSRTVLMWAQLRGTVFYGANLTRAILIRADLSHANLGRADLTGADLTGAKLTGADLADAKLIEAKLDGVDLTEAKLPRADLTRANLTGADFTNADLSNANLPNSDLAGARFRNADLTGAWFPADVPIPAGWEIPPGSGRLARIGGQAQGEATAPPA